MPEIIRNCDWQMGTVWSKSRLCGKNAKYVGVDSTRQKRLVCGIHRRRFYAIGDESTLQPLPAAFEETRKDEQR